MRFPINEKLQGFFLLQVFVPKKNVEELKQTLFEFGAGKLGHYDNWCWESYGVGQFRPLQGSNPGLGKEEELIQVEEVKIETICPKDKLSIVIEQLKIVHPYESPAFFVFPFP